MLELQIHGTSNINTFALIWLIIVSCIILYARPRYATAGLLLTALFIPLGQQFFIAGLHFRFFRVLILVAAARVILHGEFNKFRFIRLDALIIAFALIRLVCGVLRGPEAEMFGVAYDLLGTYFAFRILAPNAKDVLWQLRVLAVGVIVLAACMYWEMLTSRNPFYIFGGVPEHTLVREGRLRCQGPFRHPILAGTFAATLFPLIVGLWGVDRRSRKLALMAMASCAFTCYVAASSGALLTLLAAMAGLALWPLRRYMAVIRRFSVTSIVVLGLLMNAPIWYLIAKVGRISGGTGWHRSYLIDQAVKRIDEWWLIGSSYTAHWAINPYTILAVDPDNMDITNHYIRQALQGGLLGLMLFIWILVCCFRLVGRGRRAREGAYMAPLLVWAFGVALAAHCAAFMSVHYFDQVLIFWVWPVTVVAVSLVKSKRPIPVSSVNERRPQVGRKVVPTVGGAALRLARTHSPNSVRQGLC